MIFKVLYQEHEEEAPVREETKTLYIEAESVREVRSKLADRNYNIEYVQELSEAHLAYEQQSDDFKVEKI
ncbi:DNA-dependent RNA polymerase subunit epsilon [Piscibacillus halophilus]|uniref:DNA-directed RNA polymerase subunit epsilon n=1 Tax=Piscibacillus halophilus TaxID=571933 RepID=A0A1H9KMV9_9BACI|nr:DNA-directed RNA polymerase subunit epsilon [Piscibacillus halophilus]SER00428.1 DNA-dependent RNA polymerase auxiliary subunit epsilon [Piscibacillus halophilus]